MEEDGMRNPYASQLGHVPEYWSDRYFREGYLRILINLLRGEG